MQLDQLKILHEAELQAASRKPAKERDVFVGLKDDRSFNPFSRASHKALYQDPSAAPVVVTEDIEKYLGRNMNIRNILVLYRY